MNYHQYILLALYSFVCHVEFWLRFLVAYPVFCLAWVSLKLGHMLTAAGDWILRPRLF